MSYIPPYNFLPPGSMMYFGGSVIPEGWLLCNGQAISRIAYKDLFEAIMVTYGNGDGETTFNLPDCKGRVLIGEGKNSTSSFIKSNGQMIGEETHNLTEVEQPKHRHYMFGFSRYSPNEGGINFAPYDTRGSANFAGGQDTQDGAWCKYNIGINSPTSPIIYGGTIHLDSVWSGYTSHNNMQPYLVINIVIKY